MDVVNASTANAYAAMDLPEPTVRLVNYFQISRFVEMISFKNDLFPQVYVQYCAVVEVLTAEVDVIAKLAGQVPNAINPTAS